MPENTPNTMQFPRPPLPPRPVPRPAAPAAATPRPAAPAPAAPAPVPTPIVPPQEQERRVPRPAATGTPAPAAVRLPVIGEIYIHNVNQTIFAIVSSTAHEGGVTIRYSRYGDGETFELSWPAFVQRLTRATPDIEVNIARTAQYFTNENRGMSIPLMNNVIQQLDAQAQAQPPAAQPVEAAPGAPGETVGQVHVPPPPPRRRRDEGAPDGAPRDETDVEVGELIEPDPALNNFDRLVLYPEAVGSIFAALRSIANREQMENVWHISTVTKRKGIVLLMYGPTGTGKTESGLAVANHMGVKLYKVRYDTIISKYYGDTAKHIAAMFKKAKEHGAILFLDEADSVCSRRISMEHDGATSNNQNRNTFMQELDKYAEEEDSLPVLMASNLFANFDSAIVSRINRAIRFDLPNEPMRFAILNLMVPTRDRFGEGATLELAASMTDGFSGRNLLTTMLAVYEAASESENPDDWKITLDVLTREIAATRQSLDANAGRPTVALPQSGTPALVAGYSVPPV